MADDSIMASKDWSFLDLKLLIEGGPFGSDLWVYDLSRGKMFGARCRPDAAARASADIQHARLRAESVVWLDQI